MSSVQHVYNDGNVLVYQHVFKRKMMYHHLISKSSIANDLDISRLIVSAFDDGETMAVYSPSSTVVTVMRTELIKGFQQLRTKRMNIPLRRWKDFGRKLDYILEEVQNIQDGNESVVQQHIGGGLFLTICMSSVHAVQTIVS